MKWADIFMTNMTGRAVRQIGMTWETVHAANPGIVAMYQPMQGMTGPHAEFTGFGAVLSTVCGVNYLSGFADNPPVGVGTNYPDYVVNPIHAVIALLAALRHRRRTGEGQLIDMSQLESSVAALSGPVFAWDNAGIEHPRVGNRVPWAAPHGAFRCAETPERPDRWMVIACLDDAQWERCAAACGHPDWSLTRASRRSRSGSGTKTRSRPRSRRGRRSRTDPDAVAACRRPRSRPASC